MMLATEYSNIVFEGLYELEVYKNAVYDSYMDLEADFLRACKENCIINHETYTILQEGAKEFFHNIATKIREIWEKIKTFFLKITGQLTKANEKFLADNLDRLTSLDYSKIKSMTLLPYWKIKTNDIQTTLNSFKNVVNNVPNESDLSDEKIDNMENEEPWSTYTKNSETFKEGIRKYFTVKAFKLDREVLNSSQIETLCKQTLIPYVSTYYRSVANPLAKSLDDISRTIQNRANALANATTATTTESSVYCNLESAAFENTDMRYCINYVPVLEKKSKAHQTPAPTVNNTDENKENPKKVDVEPAEGANPESAKTETELQRKWLQKVSSLVQIAAAEALSASEERYNKYIGILREVLQVAGGVKTTTSTSTNTPVNKKADENNNANKPEAPEEKSKKVNHNPLKAISNVIHKKK